MTHINIKEILWKLHIDSLTAMQQTTVEEYRKGKDLVLLSPTGSGKTIAYLLPLVQSLKNENVLQAVVLVPSRELALQIEQVFKSMGTGIPVMSCYGGRPAMDEHRTMKSLNPQVIIGTPGRMNDHLNKGNIDASHVHTLVIDEFDKCLEMGFQEEMSEVIAQIPYLKRRFLLSATDAPAIPRFVSGISCEMFHGGMEQKDRERALYKFSNGSCNVFVSTDLAARGLDIPNIDHVIHYHLPLNEDAYIHRNGRTARWDASGNVFLILGPEEYLPEFIQQIPEDYVWEGPKPDPAKPQWVTLYIGKGKKDKINKVDIVGFLSKVGGLGKSDIGRIDVKEHYAFVAIRRNLLKETLAAVSGQKIKGIKTIIEKTK